MKLLLLAAALWAAAPKPVVFKATPVSAPSASGARLDAKPLLSTVKPWLAPSIVPGPLFDPKSAPTVAEAFEVVSAGRDEPAAMAQVKATVAKLMESPDAMLELAELYENGRALEPAQEEALAVMAAQDMMATLSDARRLYARFFPQFEKSVPLQLSYGLKDYAWGYYSSDVGIHLSGPTLPLPGRRDERSPSPFKRGGPLSSRVSRLIIAFHEYAHALYYAHTGAKHVREEQETIHDAVNEGFAVMLELLMLDKAADAKDELGLSDAEAADMRDWKRRRIASLRARNHYTEGTLRVWRAVHKRGGEKAMLAWLKALVPERMEELPMSTPLFALMGGEPTLLKALTKDGKKEWDALVSLSNHILGGQPLQDASIIHLVPSAAMKRFFSAGLKEGKSPARLAPLLRLALLDARAAKLFYESLELLDAEDALERGPAWVDAALQALPWIPGMPDWRPLARKWIAAPARTEETAKARSVAAKRLN